MKNLILLSAFILSIVTVQSQSKCGDFYPTEPGASRTLTIYDNDGNEQGSVTYTVKEVTGDQMTYSMSMSRDGTTMMENDYKMNCTDDGVSIDFNSMGGAMMSAMRSDNATVTGTDIYLPNALSVGMTLDDAEMKVSNSMDIGGRTVNTSMTMKMKDRKVEGMEDITTPAGEFKNCYRLVYYTDMSRTMPTITGTTTTNVIYKSKTIQWLKEDIGVVKTMDFMGEVTSSTTTWTRQSWGQLTAMN